MSQPTDKPLTYADSGVDIEAGDEMVRRIHSMVKRTHGPRVMDRFESFAGLFRLDYNEKLFRRNYREPVLAASTDGVGSKLKIASAMNIHDTVGIDCVAMCVNDLIVEGAEPLFFLDYIGTHDIEPSWAATVVKGVADGCRMAGCALIGGETAELPSVYAPGDYDLVGFSVGVLELDRAVDPSLVEAGDVIIGLPSSGLHSNGFSLVRRIVEVAGLDLHTPLPELDAKQPLGEVLLTPTRIYARSITRLLRKYTVKKIITGMAHITGGGLEGNVCRALGPDLTAEIDVSSWDTPRIFRVLQERGNVETAEMYRTFNMGIGYVLIVRPAFVNSVLNHLRSFREAPCVIGHVLRDGAGDVRLIGQPEFA